MREKLALEMKKVVTSLGNASQAARKREEELKNALVAQQQRLMDMRDARVDLSVMTRDVDSAQRAYDVALARYMTTKIESRAKGSNISMVTPAIEPIQPAHPKTGLIMPLSLLVGLLLGAGVVFALETFDRRVRSRADLESRLAVPSLGRLSRWQPTGGRLLPAPTRAANALPHPW
jgi:uncharacterized protein involved in exopolysaccharide biosynthesis